MVYAIERIAGEVSVKKGTRWNGLDTHSQPANLDGPYTHTDGTPALNGCPKLFDCFDLDSCNSFFN